MSSHVNVCVFYNVADSPGGVVSLSLDPSSSSNLNELVLSWQPPAGSVEGVAVTYDLSITGLSINVVNQTNFTSVSFVDRAASLECRPHQFSVTASNPAGPGPVININRTIPIGKLLYRGRVCVGGAQQP